MKLLVTLATLDNQGDDLKSLWNVVGGSTHVVADLDASILLVSTPEYMNTLAVLGAIGAGLVYNDGATKTMLVDWSVVEDADAEDLLVNDPNNQQGFHPHGNPFPFH